MNIFYDLIFLLGAFCYFPISLLRGKVHSGFIQRLGVLPRDLKMDHPIWIHAVSVGEVMAIKGLLAQLKSLYPGRQFVISTVTPTGNQIARNIIFGNDRVIYLPLDFSLIVSRVLRRIKPALFIIAETEIWPNLIRQLFLRNIPLVVVNGRISDSSFQGYQRLKFFLKTYLNQVTLFCVRTQLDADRLVILGVDKNKIRITGNMKFDIKPHEQKVDYRKKMDLEPQEKLWIAASTHAGEEEIILKVYSELTQDHPELRLMLAPRHPERAGIVEQLLRQVGFNVARTSTLATHYNRALGKSRIFLLDTLGELMSFYTAADIVFMGKSFINKGGQNLLEPACLAKPIIFGPSMFNFQDAVDQFLRQRGAFLVRNPQELKAQVSYLLRNPAEAEKAGKTAQELVLKNQGATNRNATLIKELLRI